MPHLLQQQSLRDPRCSTMLTVIRRTLALCASFYTTVAISGEAGVWPTPAPVWGLMLAPLSNAKRCHTRDCTHLVREVVRGDSPLKILAVPTCTPPWFAGYVLFGSRTDGDVLKNLTIHFVQGLVPSALAHVLIDSVALCYTFNLLVNFVLKVRAGCGAVGCWCSPKVPTQRCPAVCLHRENCVHQTVH